MSEGLQEPAAPLSGLSIVDVQDSDLPAITRIYNEAIIEGGSTADLVPRTLEQRREWVDLHRPRDQYPVVVARSAAGGHHGDVHGHQAENEVVGFGSLSRFHPRAGYDGVVELSYYVAASARHQGVGTALVEWLLTAARQRHHRMATALIFASNRGSIALMEHFGFTRFGLLPGACTDGTQLLDMSYWYLNL